MRTAGTIAAAVLACCISATAQDGQAPRRVRVIAPELVPSPPVDPESLERVAPRLPLSPPSATPDRPPRARLFRPAAVAAGLLDFGDLRVRLEAVRVVPPERVCEAAGGGTWPCGMHARTAFRLWLRGRAVACGFDEAQARQDDGAGREVEARCSVSGKDPAAWLVEQGWALAVDEGPYAELERQARTARRGVFGAGPDAP